MDKLHCLPPAFQIQEPRPCCFSSLYFITNKLACLQNHCGIRSIEASFPASREIARLPAHMDRAFAGPSCRRSMMRDAKQGTNSVRTIMATVSCWHVKALCSVTDRSPAAPKSLFTMLIMKSDAASSGRCRKLSVRGEHMRHR